ncbi:Ets Translocation Variant 4 [Manis pentadactyla]|nr:Ets Translocation Variant 4 [Manis pentadactyla]
MKVNGKEISHSLSCFHVLIWEGISHFTANFWLSAQSMSPSSLSFLPDFTSKVTAHIADGVSIGKERI